MTWLHLACLTADCSAEPITALAQLVPSRATVLEYVLPPAENRPGKSSVTVRASGSAALVSICPQGPSDGDGVGVAACVWRGTRTDWRGAAAAGPEPCCPLSQKYPAAPATRASASPPASSTQPGRFARRARACARL